MLVRIDDDEYIVLPNATSIVAIRKGDLDPIPRHEIRIIAPMVGGHKVETLQVEGIWVEEGGQLLPLELIATIGGGLSREQQATQTATGPLHWKMLEIIADLPGSVTGRDRLKTIGSNHGILGGVMG